MSYVDIDTMVGKTFTKVWENGDAMVFENDVERYTFYHDQDCCETVQIEDINGDLEDLENLPLLIAREASGETEDECSEESYTWTFYKFATFKGYVDVRWLGTSNGYYSEKVDLKYERI
jgi:hypothetical protein